MVADEQQERLVADGVGGAVQGVAKAVLGMLGDQPDALPDLEDAVCFALRCGCAAG